MKFLTHDSNVAEGVVGSGKNRIDLVDDNAACERVTGTGSMISV